MAERDIRYGTRLLLPCLAACLLGWGSAASEQSLGADGCEVELRSSPPRGPVGTIVELTGACYYIHSGASAPIYFDQQLIGRVAGETGGNYLNLLRIPLKATVGRHELRLDQYLAHSTAAYDVLVDRPCVGDCNGDAALSIDELVKGVGIALQQRPVEACPSFDFDGDRRVTVGELVAAVNGALTGCVALPGLSTFAGDYVASVSGAEDFYPGAVSIETGSVRESAPAVLEIEFPYLNGVVTATARLALDGSLMLEGVYVVSTYAVMPVSGVATIVASGEQRWLTGAVTVAEIGRSDDVYFVMTREPPPGS